MKKLLLLAAFALCASPAFAQNNDAAIDQIGDQNVANAVQTGSQNDADITQYNEPGSGVNSQVVAEVFQSGSGNIADVDQELTRNDKASFSAYIDQSGAANYAKQEQGLVGPDTRTFGLTASIEQVGTSNHAEQYQSKRSNEAIIEQGLNDAASSGNEAYQRQDVSNPSDNGETNHYALAQQDGSANKAYQDQSDTGNHAEILQNGSGNIADQDQKGVTSSAFNQSYITQDGALGAVSNEAYNFQHADGAWSSIVQTGEANYADVEQYGNGHTSDVMQSGMGNTSTVTQSD